eukprot:2295863-Pleurochrysis_carterae.AAC.1
MEQLDRLQVESDQSRKESIKGTQEVEASAATVNVKRTWFERRKGGRAYELRLPSPAGERRKILSHNLRCHQRKIRYWQPTVLNGPTPISSGSDSVDFGTF